MSLGRRKHFGAGFRLRSGGIAVHRAVGRQAARSRRCGPEERDVLGISIRIPAQSCGIGRCDRDRASAGSRGDLPSMARGVYAALVNLYGISYYLEPTHTLVTPPPFTPPAAGQRWTLRRAPRVADLGPAGSMGLGPVDRRQRCRLRLLDEPDAGTCIRAECRDRRDPVVIRIRLIRTTAGSCNNGPASRRRRRVLGHRLRHLGPTLGRSQQQALRLRVAVISTGTSRFG